MTEQRTQTQDSTTEVNLRLDGPRETVSLKCNRKLWKAFVTEIKAEGLSVCHVLEPYVLTYLTSKVYLSSTIKPLRIENSVVERAVRRVRRYGVEPLSSNFGLDWFDGFLIVGIVLLTALIAASLLFRHFKKNNESRTS